jgi:colicin import membrane protein
MKDFQKPPFKENAIALGFTVSIHIVAIVGLLYLGMSKIPESPQPLKTVLVKPEDLQPITREVTDFTETADTQVAEQITQTAEPVADAPVIPIPAPSPAPSVQAQQKFRKKSS